MHCLFGLPNEGPFIVFTSIKQPPKIQYTIKLTLFWKSEYKIEGDER